MSVNVLFLALAIFVEVSSGNLTDHKGTNGISSFPKGVRWVIEKLHPLRSSLTQNGLPKSIVETSRQAFAAAEHILHNHLLGKKTNNLRGGDLLKKIASRIKEEEDASVQSSQKAGVVKEGIIQRYQGPANVVFLLDGSGDIGFKEIQFYKLFVKEVYNNIHIPPGGVKFGLLECGTKHFSQKNVLIRSITSSKMLDITLNDLVPMNGYCELGKSMKMINTNIFKRLPIDTPKALIVVLAGKSLDKATSVAKEVKEGGSRIVALGTGEQADMKQLSAIADSPLYAFKVPLFKYLPSMTSTVIGFINKVTEPKYSSNLIPSSKPLSLPKEGRNVGFSGEFVDEEVKELGKDRNNDKTLLAGLRPILSELNGYDSSLDWSPLLQDKEVPQDYPPTTENTIPSPTIPQNYWKIEREKQNVTDWQDGSQLQDSNIKDANNAPANSMSNGQSEANSTPNASSTFTPNKQGSKVNPASQAAIVAGSQGRNQANGQWGLGLIGNGVASSSSGVNQGNGISSNASPGNTGSSSQGSGPPIAVIPANGGGSPNSGGANTANTGLSGGIPGQTGNAPASSGQPGGPVQVIQTQLLPIPVLPVQTLPIQTLSPVLSPQGQFPSITPNQQQQLQPTNQTKVSQVNERESTQNPNQPVSGKSEQNPDPSVSVSGPKNNKGNKGQEEATFQTRTKPPNGQPTASSSVNKETQRSTASQQHTTTSPSQASPTEDNNSSSGSNSTKAPNSNKIMLPTKSTPVPQRGKTATATSTNSSIVNLNKPNGTQTSGKANAALSTFKPKVLAAGKPSQKPQVVLCQIICGSDCCPIEVKAPTAKPTAANPTTKSTTLPPTSAKGEAKQKPTTPQEVIAAPPVPMRHHNWPGWFPQLAHPMPGNPVSAPITPPFMYMTLPPAAASPVLDKERFRQVEHQMHTAQVPAVPPLTISSAVSSQEDKDDPILIGQCQDYHPDCYSFVMSGMCDDKSIFKEAFSVRDFCMLSCGVCNRYIKQGEKVSLDVRDKGRDPEEIGLPEYSKKFV